MKNHTRDDSYLDGALKRLEKDIQWKEASKNRLEQEILVTISQQEGKAKFLTWTKYVLSIGVMVVLMLIGYQFLSDSLTSPTDEIITENPGSDTGNKPAVDEQDEEEPKEDNGNESEEARDDNDKEEVLTDNDDENESEEAESDQPALDVLTGATETTTIIVEGFEVEVEVTNYQIKPYNLTYQLDEDFGVPEVSSEQITHSMQDGDYQIVLEVEENTTLEQTVAELQAKFEAESDMSFELLITPLEENGLTGMMQSFESPLNVTVTGFFAYDIGEHVLVITYHYPIQAWDGMFPLLDELRKSIVVQ